MHANKMEERRTAYALLFSIIVILVYTEVVMAPYRPVPPTPQGTEQAQQQTATETATTEPIAYHTPTPTAAATSATPSTPQPAIEKTPVQQGILSLENAMNSSPGVTIESSLIKAKLSLLGGRITSLQLKGYQKDLHPEGDTASDFLEMITGHEGFYPLGVVINGVSDVASSYSLQAPATDQDVLRVPADGTLKVVLQGTFADGSTIVKELTFSDDDYLFHVNIRQEKQGGANEPIILEWLEYVPPHDVSRYNPEQFILLEEDGSIERYTIDDISEKPLKEATRWLAYGDNYFTTAMVPEATGPNAVLEKKKELIFYRTLGGTGSAHFRVYSGPKNQKTLTKAGFELTRTIDLGWFGFIGQPIILMLNALYGVFGNYGLAIILLTVMMKLALLPLTKTSLKSMNAMKEVQPEINALRDRISDPQQLQQEIMALYKKKGVNPLGGCLPMVLQLPIFLGMFNALRSSIELRHAPFALWVQDLAAPESLMIAGIGIPVMVILMGASMFLQQLTTPSAGDPAQQKAMLIAPVLFTGMFIIFPVPAGLVLYFLCNNLISISQQAAMKEESQLSPLNITLVVGMFLFGIGYVMTLAG